MACTNWRYESRALALFGGHAAAGFVRLCRLAGLDVREVIT